MESEGKVGTASSSSRWNPTKEQITMLENIYKQGVRTPSADQIQQITGRLRTYGHIEGKNVFYWFQNHKARQRQKQKQERIAYFNRLIHKTSRFFYPPPCSNVGCVSPYYIQQVNNYQHGSNNNAMIRNSGHEIRTIPENRTTSTTRTRMSMTSSSLRFDRFTLGDHGYNGEGNNVNSDGRKTLPLFPLQPLDASVDHGVGNSGYAPEHDSPVVCYGGDGGKEQPFIDFFSGSSSRFG